MPQPHAWFAFPLGGGSEERLRELAAAHVGRAVIGLSTPIPGERTLSLVQVLTFFDPSMGGRHHFPEGTRRRFRELALSLHAGFRVQEQRLIAAIVSQAIEVRAAFDATNEELFVLAPTRMAPLVQQAIQQLLEEPGALVTSWPEAAET